MSDHNQECIKNKKIIYIMSVEHIVDSDNVYPGATWTGKHHVSRYIWPIVHREIRVRWISQPLSGAMSDAQVVSVVSATGNLL